MRRALLFAGAALLLAAPAFGDEVRIEKRTITRDEPATSTTTVEKTITKEEPGSGSTVSTVVIAPQEPPAPRVETPPPPPREAAAWLPGHWRWDPAAGNFVWVGGHYAEPPRPRATWAPGHWVQRPGGWVWQEGHWD